MRLSRARHPLPGIGNTWEVSHEIGNLNRIGMKTAFAFMFVLAVVIAVVAMEKSNVNISNQQYQVERWRYSGYDDMPEQVVNYWEKEAETGDATAAFYMGMVYRDGNGREQSMGRSVQYLQQAALEGHPIAQNSLGVCYMKGEGVEQDYALARHWFEKSAAQGNSSAKRNLESALDRLAKQAFGE